MERKRIWGWYFFDWASQPYNTLLLTFIFGPYVAKQIGDGAQAQAVWGYGIGIAGLLIALLSPLLGAVADKSGGRMGFVWFFSLLYVLGAGMLWFSAPDSFNVWTVMIWFAIGLIGMEFATTFTNAMLPDLAPKAELGKISGSGWAFGYLGGLVTLVIMLTLFSEGESGKTMLGIVPILGLDPAASEGTRAVGPLTAVWYVLFMIPFFLWVREAKRPDAMPIGAAMREALPELRQTISTLPQRPSLFAYLASSMFQRDALNGIYTFGGIYAAGVLGWGTMQMGIFGIIAIITGAIFAWLGGRADSAFGPKPVIMWTTILLTLVSLGVVFVSRGSVFGIPVAEGSGLPDTTFMILGALIGAGGGALQSASRTMMIHQSDPDKITEAFGLYALAGKATSFLAPLGIAVVTHLTGSQSLGILPIVGLFALGLWLMLWVKPDGDRG